MKPLGLLLLLLLLALVVTTHAKYRPTTSCSSPNDFLFTVSSSHCPAGFATSLLAQLNAQRRVGNLKPLKISPEINDAIESWLVDYGPESADRPNYPDYGQLNWQKWWDSPLSNQLPVNAEEPFQTKWGTGEALPLYTGSGKARKYQWKEWQSTSKIGIGCSMARGEGAAQSKITLHVVMFFEFTGTKPIPVRLPPNPPTTTTPTTTKGPKGKMAPPLPPKTTTKVPKKASTEEPDDDFADPTNSFTRRSLRHKEGGTRS